MGAHIVHAIVTVVVVVIAAGVWYLVRQQYQRPSHLRYGMVNTDYEVIKTWGKALYVAQNAALLGVVIGALLLLWSSTAWEIALGVLCVSIVLGLYAQHRYGELERNYYVAV